MNDSSWDLIPIEIRQILVSEETGQANKQIYDQFSLTHQEYLDVVASLISIFAGKSSALDLPTALAQIKFSHPVDLHALALSLAEKRLWPLQQFLGNVDRLILNLGGKVPALVIPKPVVEEAGGQPSAVVNTAKEFLEAAGQRKSLWLTSQKITDPEDNAQDPTIEQWLRDFLRNMGPAMSDGLTRSQYLVRSNNAKVLSEEDKDNLLNFLTSYGEDSVARFQISGNRLLVRPIVTEQLGADEHKQTAPVNVDMTEISQRYQEYVQQLRSMVDKIRNGLQVEISGQTNRLADVLWNGLGLGEADRALTALIMLAERQALADIITKDLRFVGILRRYISVRFGDQVKQQWQPAANLSSQVLFLQLVLQEKLSYSSETAAMAANYIGSLAGLEPIVYIDLTRGKFTFRDVINKGGQLVVEGVASK